MNLYQETKFIMNKYNITAKKSYGQNFLIDENIVNQIIESANISKNDLIIEIGPGLGTLTSSLLEKAGKVICIELDTNMIKILNDRFSLYNNFELVNEDILKVDLKNLLDLNQTFKKVKVVANLPYYITTPIIMKLLEEKLPTTAIESITVMVQKEVAQRLTSVPGSKNTGSITYTINYYTNPKYVFDVPKESFIPEPKVNSAVINLEVLKRPKIDTKDEKFFFNIIKAAFLQKRKTLINSLTNSGISDKQTLENILKELNLNVNIRAEQLSLDDFNNISNLLCENKKIH